MLLLVFLSLALRKALKSRPGLINVSHIASSSSSPQFQFWLGAGEILLRAVSWSCKEIIVRGGNICWTSLGGATDAINLRISVAMCGSLEHLIDSEAA